MDLTNLRRINEQKALEQETNTKHNELLLDNTRTQETIVKSFKALVDYLDNRVSKTAVVNQLREIGTPDAMKVVEAVNGLHETLKKHENTDITPLTEVMKSVLTEVKSLPKDKLELPEQKFVDYSKQLSSLEATIKSVEKAVKAQELKVEAPVVNVPETQVNVDAPDLKPIEKSVQTGSKEVVKAVKGIKIPEFKTKSIEDLLKKTNKLLNELPDYMPSGSGSGSSWPAVNTAGTPMPLNLDADGKLITTATGGGAGTEYTEGDVDASFTGGIALVEGAGNTAVTLKQPTQPTDTQPVSGTVTANLSATDNAVLDDIALNQTDGTQKTSVVDVAGHALDLHKEDDNFAVGADYGVPIMGLRDGTPQQWQYVRVDTIAGDANTVPAKGVVSTEGFNMLYNGTTWDRARGDATNGQLVNLGANNDVTVTSGSITETNSAAIKTAVETIDNAISGSEMQVDVVGALPAGTNAIGKLSANSGVDIGDVDVTSAVSSSFDHGSNLDIDATAEQITSTSFACKFGVTVKADITNTGIIYIGNSDVTAGSTAATDGFPLSAGETLTLEVNNPNLLYAIASTTNQKIYWSAV